MTRLLAAFVMVFGFGLASAAAQDAQQVAKGKQVFETQKCAMCHQVAGQGNRMYPLDGVATKLTEADIRTWLTAPAEMEAKLDSPPRLKMSARKLELKPDELEALVAYLKTLK
jgi:mono/diheme cytochrome c family protein